MADNNENMDVTENNVTPETAPVLPKSEKPAKEKKEKKGPNAFVRLFLKIKKFVRDIISELKKVVWTSKTDLRKNTILVVVAVVAFSAAIFVVDISGGALVEALAKLIK